MLLNDFGLTCSFDERLLVRSEINIRPWQEEFPDIKRGSQAVSWKNKMAWAYWRGNPDVASPIRVELLNCNDTRMWGAQIMRQVWLSYLAQFGHYLVMFGNFDMLCVPKF